jgi:hypothetical protein
VDGGADGGRQGDGGRELDGRGGGVGAVAVGVPASGRWAEDGSLGVVEVVGAAMDARATSTPAFLEPLGGGTVGGRRRWYGALFSPFLLSASCPLIRF